MVVQVVRYNKTGRGCVTIGKLCILFRRTVDATTNDRTTPVVTVQVEIEVELIVYI